MLPLEFTVEGPPLSHQTRDRLKLQAWRAAVRAAALRGWASRTPVGGSVRLTVGYYHDGPAVRIDNDNLLKPIQDALNKLIYVDDTQVTDTVVYKRDINGPFVVRGASIVLLTALSNGVEFLHVKVETAPDSARIPGQPR